MEDEETTPTYRTRRDGVTRTWRVITGGLLMAAYIGPQFLPVLAEHSVMLRGFGFIALAVTVVLENPDSFGRGSPE